MNLRFHTTPIAAAVPWDPVAVARHRADHLAPGLGEAFIAQEAAATNLEQLLAGRATCVTTGQQPGLLLGPLYTIYKAISAVGLARTLSEYLDRAVIPVFWVAGDDHDLAEANHVHVVNLANEVEAIRLGDRDEEAPLVPLYKEPLGAAIDDVFARLRAATPDTEFRPAILAWAERHYRAAADFATAFAGALAELLGPHGLVVFMPTHRAAKQAMAPYLLAALERAAELDTALNRRGRALAERGHEVPVAVGDGASTVMIEGSLGRDRLIVEAGRFVSRRSRESWTLGDVARIAASEPERLSPNVLLRPVVEAALLPTLAYVAGPGELAYAAQCAPLYEALEVTPQPFLPRWSARILEPRVTKVLQKYGLEPEILVQEGQAEARLLQEELPADATDAMRRLRRALTVEYERLELAAMTIDPTLKKSVASHRNAALAGVNDIERRIVAHLKKQNDILVQQVSKVRHNLFPLGRPQERVFNALPYLIRYGPAFVDAALRASAEWNTGLESAPHRA